MNKLEILITVHALSTWNELGRSQGHCDTELNEYGCFMAEQLAQRKDLENVKKIYTSDLENLWRGESVAVAIAQR
jgi:broad specificity phosphatase PhoE